MKSFEELIATPKGNKAYNELLHLLEDQDDVVDSALNRAIETIHFNAHEEGVGFQKALDEVDALHRMRLITVRLRGLRAIETVKAKAEA